MGEVEATEDGCGPGMKSEKLLHGLCGLLEWFYYRTRAVIEKGDSRPEVLSSLQLTGTLLAAFEFVIGYGPGEAVVGQTLGEISDQYEQFLASRDKRESN